MGRCVLALPVCVCLIPLKLDITKHNNNVTDSTVQNVCVQKWALHQSIHLTWGTLGPRFSARQLLMLGGWSQQAFPTVCGSRWVCWQDYCTEEKSPSRYVPAGHKHDSSFWTFTSSRCPAKQRGTGVRFTSVQQTLYADDNSQQAHTHTHSHTRLLIHTHTSGGQCFAQAAVCNYPVGLDFSGVSLVIEATVIPFS